jgi:tRNA(Ile)-lysidine synthase
VLTQNALHDEAVRFAADLAALTGPLGTDRLGLAVSGGPDSVAMLVLAHAAFPGRIAAATVDHKLRAASGAEARFVGVLCAERAIPHTILPLDGLARGNASAAARDARYDALDDWADSSGLDWLLTAHHADDQLETMIMRLNRGSGVAGLAGVRRRRGRIVRPVLGWRRSELAAVVAAAGVTPVDDPSNRDDRYDRARLRKVLAEARWLDPIAAAVSASALAEVEDATCWSVDWLERTTVIEKDGFVSFDRARHGFPAEYLRRIVLRCLKRVDPVCAPREAGLRRVIAALETGKITTIGGVICRPGATWLFHRAPPRRAI